MRRASSLSRWRVRVDECRLQKGGRGQRASVGFAIPVGARRLVCIVVRSRRFYPSARPSVGAVSVEDPV